MKHTLKVVIVLIGMFFVAQLIGLAVLGAYAPQTKQVPDANGTLTNVTVYNLPYGTEPPQDNNPQINLVLFIVALVVGVALMFFLMRFKVNVVIRWWFFIIIIFALAVAINAALLKLPMGPLIALLIALPLAYFKVFKRNIAVHNITELLIYPGIAAIFVPLLNLTTVILLLVFISLYDMYAVWHAGFMQKMAKYQIQHLKVFSGFFIPYIGTKDAARMKAKTAKASKQEVKVHVAILGGGDVIFPILLGGVVLRSLGVWHALIISLGATIALACLFWYSEKGKFYPAMPFITAGCFIALGLAYLI